MSETTIHGHGEAMIYKAPGLHVWSDGYELKVKIGEHFSAFHLDGPGTESAIRGMGRMIEDLQAAQEVLKSMARES